MATRCELCGKSRSTVYCRAEAVSLCLSCDRDVHGANVLSKRHLRTLLCDRCRVQPAAFSCNIHELSFCHDCDKQSHSINSPQHKRTSINYYTGCPSAAELSELWCCELDGPIAVEKEGPDAPGIGWGDSVGLDGTVGSLNLAASVHAGFKHNLGSWMEPSVSRRVVLPSNVNRMIFDPNGSGATMAATKKVDGHLLSIQQLLGIDEDISNYGIDVLITRH